MKRFCAVVTILTAVPLPATCEISLSSARATLEKYGVSYCLQKAGGEIGAEASVAVGGYFQLGSHDEPKVYTEVNAYIDSYVKSTSVYQGTTRPAILMHCLDLVNDHLFEELIVKQDRHVAR